MRSTFKILLYHDLAKTRADGMAPIFCRITIDGKRTVITTGIYCVPEDWNSKKGEVTNSKQNKQLISFRKRVEEAYATILKENRVVSAELLKNTITGINSVPKHLL